MSKNNVQNQKENIKNFLMDQKNVSGLGNIYVNEILFQSSINPRKLMYKLNNTEISRNLKNTQQNNFK